MRSNIICPFCLDKNTISKQKSEDGRQQYYKCHSCQSTIPREYAENKTARTEIISVVGFRGHGKTLYFSSLFNSMDRLAEIWSNFYTFATDETSLDTVRDNIISLKKGQLPPPTPASFPVPTNIRFSNIPTIGNRFFLFYDTGGEAYAKASKLIKYASFVKRSRTIIFLVSLKEIEFNGLKLHDLLTTYVQGLTELGGNPANQDLMVVFSKGDILGPRLKEYKLIREYLGSGSIESLRSFKLATYILGMKRISSRLKKFAKNELKAVQFLNFAADRFKSVEFSIISSLGAKPDGNRLHVQINPKCIFDPLIWVSYKSMGWFERIFLSWRD